MDVWAGWFLMLSRQKMPLEDFWRFFSDVIINVYWVKVHFSICCSLRPWFCVLNFIFLFLCTQKTREKIRAQGDAHSWIEKAAKLNKKNKVTYTFVNNAERTAWNNILLQLVFPCPVSPPKRANVQPFSGLANYFFQPWFIRCLHFKSDSMKDFVLNTN